MATAELISANSFVPSRRTTTQKKIARNPANLEHANIFTGKSEYGYVRTCMCGCHGCIRDLVWRHVAIQDPLEIVGKYIHIPPLPTNPRSEAQKKTALFVEMIYNTLGLPIGSATKKITLSILHWHPSQRSAMLRSKSKPLNRGLLEPEIDAQLIRRLLSEGHLSVDEELHGGFYFNKPKYTMQSIEDELEKEEINVWTQTGQLLEKVILANETARVGKPPNGKRTFGGLLEEKINANVIDPAENSCTEPEYVIPFFLRSKKKKIRKNDQKRTKSLNRSQQCWIHTCPYACIWRREGPQSHAGLWT